MVIDDMIYAIEAQREECIVHLHAVETRVHICFCEFCLFKRTYQLMSSGHQSFLATEKTGLAPVGTQTRTPPLGDS